MAVTDHTSDVLDQFRELRATKSRRLRNELVELHLDLAEFYVKRYRGRGVPADDVRQVALIAILAAVERFDPDLGIAFRTFASRTIEGEVKRYFRDRTWTVRPPRRSQELHLQLRRSDELLAQAFGRPPTVEELAQEVGATVDHVLEALEAGGAHQATSIDHSPGGDAGVAVGAERIVSERAEDSFAAVDHRLVLTELLEGLPDRERLVIELRFFRGLSQPEIAQQIGVSQSYLSRILRKTLARLRAELGEGLPEELLAQEDDQPAAV